MKKYLLENNEYELFENYKDGFDYEEVKNKYTDYFDDYDYIIGDWAYGKLRLKGFYNENSSKCTKLNNIANYKEYIKLHCAYECKYFVLKKVKNEKGN